MKDDLTLADFSVPISLYCIHCAKKLSSKSQVDYDPARKAIGCRPLYLTVRCPKCGCMTPFKLEDKKS